jgi:rhamnose transport system ATP-binding protein
VPPLLSLTHIQKSFGGARALAGADLHLHAGQVTALIGENGAGKSTLVKILSGYHQPDAGEIHIEGRAVRIPDAEHARRLGISVVHQECVVFDNLSVAENLFVHTRPSERGFVAWRRMRERAAVILRELDADFDPDMGAGRLSLAQKHVVQIARALTGDARVLILDEPTASLSHREVADLFRITRQLRGAGRAILFISHKFEEIFDLADRYTVFRDGASVGEGTIAQTQRDELVRLMVGRPVDQLFPKTAAQLGEELLRIEGLSRANEFLDVSFSVRRGEILGIYGLVGAGRTEVAQTLFGLSAPDAGSIHLDGAAVTLRSTQDAVRAGIAYVPEDRQTQGAILPFSIAANLALPNLMRLAPRGWCSRARETQLANEWIRTLSVRARGPEQDVQDLSGGNQQKIVIAKWLARQPRVLILDEPTKGIDVGAKAAVHAVMNDFAQRGNAVVMISSELPEILGMSDRILVMRRGRTRGIFERATATSESIVRAATDA